MAHIGCNCGASLSNVMCPSENVIYIMKKERIESALKYNFDLTLMDFITNWDVLTNSIITTLVVQCKAINQFTYSFAQFNGVINHR